LDIKTIIPYVVDQTTHVVQSKRNTAKGLQALVNGKYIVDQSYVDALVYAATPSDLENLESLSPLEADFDTTWPDPSLHLPPPGKEPMQRPPESFAPNPDRINIFDGYTFVFGDVTQYQNLVDPINNGHGKALIYQVDPGVTMAEELVQFMRNAAGTKGLGEEREGSGGVVLVRFRSQGQYENWSIELGNQVAVMTDQRVIQQSEFLDAILANDASSLCRSLPPAPDSGPETGPEVVPESQPKPISFQLAPTPRENVEPPPVSQTSENVSQAPNSQPSRSKESRVRGFVSKMKNFDDGFDLASIPAYVPEEGGAESSLPSAIDLEQLSKSPSQQLSRKPSQKSQQPSQRPSLLKSVEEDAEEEEEDVMTGLLPGANAMKRRRAETGPRRRASPDAQPKEEAERKPKRQKLDILEAARKHREAEDNAQRRQEEEETRRDDLNDTPVEKLKGLAIVEEWDVPLRKPHETREKRWDERWNGRKNFKKFRRKGEPRYASTRVQRVIVPLVEVTRKDYGIGSHYWAGSYESRTDSPAVSHPREQHHANDGADVEEDGTFGGSTAPPASVFRVESEASSQNKSRNRSQKRPREVRDSDSEDELRFRFRRRR
jgi:hypothetical protein